MEKKPKGGNVIMYCFCLTRMVKGQIQTSEMVNSTAQFYFEVGSECVSFKVIL